MITTMNASLYYQAMMQHMKKNTQGGEGRQSQLMQYQESSYNETRAEDAMQVERQLTEIGQMMTKLATMVAEQRETILTINTNIDDSRENVEGAISMLIVVLF